MTKNPPPEGVKSRRTHRTTTVVAIASLLAAGVLGAGWAVSASQASDHTIALATRVKNAESKLKEAKLQIDDYKRRASASDAAQKRASDQASELSRKIEAADALQAQLDAEQATIAAAQISDGVHVVGSDTQPGVYSISSATDCYYAWMTSTASDAKIISNNIVSGPATVTLRAGDVFETNGCGTWNKTG